MGDFKQQFNNAFKEAPSFSMQARENVKRQSHHQKKSRWMQASIVVAAAVALVSFIIWNDELLGRFSEQSPASLAAPEHEDKMEIFSEVKPDNETQFTITNSMNSMNRGNGEYTGYLAVETKFDDIQYGQVLMLEDGRVDDAFRYVFGRVIGKPGDKVAIEEGQLYLNDLPIETFYGKAQIMGTTDVEEAFERLRKVQSTEWEETIEAALHETREPFVLQEDEYFIVSDNWARNSVRKTFTEEQIEGVVLGYSEEMSSSSGWRKMNDEEFSHIKELSEQVFKGIRTQDPKLLEVIASKNFLVQSPYNDINSILKIDVTNVTLVNHYISYYSYAFIGNSSITLNKSAYIEYKIVSQEEPIVLRFVMENDDWKLADVSYY